MEITQSTPQQSTSQASSSGRAGLTSDYEMFLKMLTTQMTNQDPLNPVDSSDYAVQLATFSSVEQQVKTNELLQSLSTGMGISQLAGWIGREVTVPAPAQFSGNPVSFTAKLPEAATRASLSVFNSSGDLVRSQSLDVTTDQFTWDGRDQTGALVSRGSYSYSVSAHNGDTLIFEAEPHSVLRITEARVGDANPVLVAADGSEIETSDILGIRE